MAPNPRTDRIIEYGFALLSLAVVLPAVAYFNSKSSLGAAKPTNTPVLDYEASSGEAINTPTQTNPDPTLAFAVLGFLKATVVTLVRSLWLVLYHTPRFFLLHTPRGVIMLLGGLLQPLHPLLAPLYLALEILAFLTIGPLLFVMQVMRAFYPLYTIAGAACLIGAGTGGLARWASLAATEALFPPKSRSKVVKSRRGNAAIKEGQDEKITVKKEGHA